MPKAIRLAVIGAGSAQFSLGLVRDICLTEALNGSEIAFMDVDTGRLDLVYELAQHYASEMGTDLRFQKTTEREAALRDADFVINTALVGGHGHEEAERALLDARGYYRGIHLADTYRQFDLMLGVARDIERICPNAWLIQSSNPVFEGCTLMARETGVKLVGLCHGPFGGYREMSKVMGFDLSQATFEAPGFNHIVWLTKFRYKGQDAYPMLDEWIKNESAAFWRTWQPTFGETQMSPAAIHMYQFYGLLPIGDASRALWSEVWWYHTDLATKKRGWGHLGGFDSNEGWQKYLDKLNVNLEQIRQTASDARLRVTEVFPPKKSGEQMVPIIDALANDHQGYFTVNVLNNGALPGVPHNVVVEVPAIADGMGIRPLVVEPLPEKIMLGVIWPAWLALERKLAAFRTGDKAYLMQQMMADHRTRTWEQAEQTLDALMSMPGNEAFAQHFSKRPKVES